jgi:rhodanese-related sulfurtransferase
MPTEVSLTEVQRLIDDGAQLVEALPANEYGEEHLPGAISMPLKELTSERASELDAARPVIVYCWNDT